MNTFTKQAGAICLMLAGALGANAQYVRTSYFMKDTPWALQLNPALAPERGYINIPVMGALNVTAGTTSMGYGGIMDVAGDEGDFWTNPKFMDRLKAENGLDVSLNTQILSAGWWKGQGFWSVGVGLRTDIGASLTKGMFSFLNEMDELEDSWRTGTYDVSGQKLDVNAYTEVGVGYARAIGKRLNVGGRVKLLLGIGNLNLQTNAVRMSANLPSDARINELSRLGISDVNSIAKLNALKAEIDGYRASIDVDARLQSSFKGLELEEDFGYISDAEVDGTKAGIAGYGLGIDLGAQYKLTDRITLSASVVDLGFISWSKQSTQTATARSSSFSMRGSDYTASLPADEAAVLANPQAALDAVKSAINSLQTDIDVYADRTSGGDLLDYDMLQLRREESAGGSRTTGLASTVVLGAEYGGLLGNRLTVGALSTTRFLPLRTLQEFTLSANYRPKAWLEAALSYSLIQSAGKTFGLALKIGPLFVGTDYLFLGNDTKTVNAHIGLSVPLGKKTSRAVARAD